MEAAQDRREGSPAQDHAIDPGENRGQACFDTRPVLPSMDDFRPEPPEHRNQLQNLRAEGGRRMLDDLRDVKHRYVVAHRDRAELGDGQAFEAFEFRQVEIVGRR